MKIKMNTFMAHPKHGVARVGQVIDLPDADAKPTARGRPRRSSRPKGQAGCRGRRLRRRYGRLETAARRRQSKALPKPRCSRKPEVAEINGDRRLFDA